MINIQEQTKILRSFINEYKQTGNDNIYQEFDVKYQEIQQYIQEVRQKYEKAVVDVIQPFLDKRANKNEDVKIIIQNDFSVILDGNLDFRNYKILPEFPGIIKIITGYLNVYSAEIIDLSYLQEVGGSLSAHSAKTLNLPRLQKVGSILSILSAKTINLSHLQEVGGWLSISSAKNVNMPQIQNIKENVYINPSNKNILDQAREWKKKGILKGEIKDKNGKVFT